MILVDTSVWIDVLRDQNGALVATFRDRVGSEICLLCRFTLLAKLDSKQKGLDFGCGPGPTLSVLFEERGLQVDLYDPFYYNDPSVFYKNYDFICATEVVEHMHDPDKDFAALFKMLKRGGWLGIMTKLVIDEHAFSQWHYIRDMTHICFYSRSTFEYLAQRFNAELNFIANDVILLNKKD